MCLLEGGGAGRDLDGLPGGGAAVFPAVVVEVGAGVELVVPILN